MASLDRRKIPISKSPIWPALLSALVAPGVGQLANRDFGKGIFLLVSSVASFVWFSKVVTERLSTLLPGTPEQWATNPDVMREALLKLVGENGEMFVTFQVLILLIWGFAVLDAYFTARKLRTNTVTNEDPNTLG